jgi:hypothetical protein
MAAVAEPPAATGINREGALMISPMNGAIGAQSLPSLNGIVQIAWRQEVDHFTLPGRL